MEILKFKRKALLDEDQLKAVEMPIQVAKVEAIAGAGKTHCLTHRIANLVDHGVNPRTIMMITFTRKAAQEMVGRVADILGVEETKMQVWGGTFHALAIKFLRDFYSQEKFNIILDKEERSLFNMELAIAYRNKQIPASGMMEDEGKFMKKYSANNMLDLMDKAKKKGVTRETLVVERNAKIQDENSDLKLDLETVYFVTNQFKEAKKRNGQYSFDDLLEEWLKRLEEDASFLGAMRRQIQHIFVDEYQDVNEVQFKIVKILTQKSLFAIGDKAQSIYLFRGSMPKYIKNFESDFREFSPKSYTIRTNYRSGENILINAQNLIQHSYSEMELIPFLEGQGRVFKSVYTSVFEEADNIMDYINQNVEDGRFEYKDHAILVRGKRAANIMEVAAKKMGVPVSTVGTGSFFDLQTVKDACLYLNFLTDPNNAFHAQAMFSMFDGIGEHRAIEIYQYVSVHGLELDKIKARTKFKAVRNACDKLIRLMVILGEGEKREKALKDPVVLYDHFVQEFYMKKLIEKNTNTLGIVDELELRKRESELTTITALLEKAEDTQSFLDLLTIDDNIDQDGKEDDGEKVKVMTMHASKGLEFPVVFLPSWSEESFPPPYAINSKMTQQEIEESIEQERNLGYVGITRAKEECYVSVIKKSLNQNPVAPSRFFNEAGFRNAEDL